MDMQHLAHHLAQNLIARRRARQLSQAALAAAAGLPRSTVTHMESGAGNPSLVTLAKVAAALQVNIEQLLSRPSNAVQLTLAAELPQRDRGGGKVRVTRLLPESLGSLAIDRLQFKPAGTMRGTPGVRGTRLFLYVLEGAVRVFVAGEVVEVVAGNLLAFPADQAHTVRHSSGHQALVMSVVLPVPAGQQ